MVYRCCQVDDFAVASDSITVAEYIISKIDKWVTTSSKGIGTKYNGIDVLQTRDYIKLYCKSFIDKVLLLHGWSKPSPSISACHDIIPLSPDAVSHLQDLIDPPEHTKEHTLRLKKELNSAIVACLVNYCTPSLWSMSKYKMLFNSFLNSPPLHIWITIWHLRVYASISGNINCKDLCIAY